MVLKHELPAGTRLGVLLLGRSSAKGHQSFVLAGRSARGDSCERSRKTMWTEEKVRRLQRWLDPSKRKRGQPLDDLLSIAGKALGHASASVEGLQRMMKARKLSRGCWHGDLDLEALMQAPGYVVVRGVVSPSDCAKLVDAAEASFGAKALRTACEMAHRRALDDLAGGKVHAELPDDPATLQILPRNELMQKLKKNGRRAAAADAAWTRAVGKVAACAGHDADQSADEAVNLGAHGMADQAWHQDSTASLAYVIALTRADATEFLQIGERWLDVMACGAAKRNAFLKRAWGATATGEVTSAGTLEPGDVVFFYTQRIHRAPPAPAIGSPRYTLFGAFCRKGKTADKELTKENWQERWVDVDAKSRKTRADASWLS